MPPANDSTGSPPPPDTAPPVDRRFRDSGLRRQAQLSVVLLVASIATLLVVAFLGFETLSSARAYVGGESLWSKAQKDAVNHLLTYAYRRDPAEFEAFQARLVIPHGDRVARLELERAVPDPARVREGFLAGGNHPDDIEGMSRFFRRFRRVSFVSEAVGYWAQGDSLIAELERVGNDLHRELQGPAPDSARIGRMLGAVDRLSVDLTGVEEAFSQTLGAGARWTARVLFLAIGLIALILLSVAGLSLLQGMRRFEALEASRRVSEEQLDGLVQHAQFGIVRSTIEGRMLSANPALVRMLGYGSEAELLQIDVHRDLYFDPADRIRILDRLLAGDAVGSEVLWRKRGGEPITVRLHGRIIRSRGDATAIAEAFVEDVTQQRALEGQLRQAQKMEVVGQLTGGIAHDFNNLLTVILSHANLVEQSLPATASDQLADVAELKQAARRGAEMIRKLLAFSRDQKLQFHPHPLGPLVEAGTAMLRRLLPESIEVRVRIEDDTPAVRADPAAIEQILLNLATNARDAMPAGGVLEVSVERAGGGLIRVRDTGTGMDAATRERLFEPFFTTKDVGRGTGLGLTMVYGLVSQLGGTIEIDSAIGRGTTVRILLPVAEAGIPEGSVSGPELVRGSGTILLVEDEDALRRAAIRLLTHHGYRVFEARDGEEALALFADHADDIDLVLTDVVMPRMSGTALYEALRRQGTTVPFVFMSGYINQESGGASALPEGVPFIPKPWSIEELLLVLQEARPLPPAGDNSPG